MAQQDLQKCPKRTSPLFGGVKKIATCANCAHASSGRVSWNASQNGPQTRGEHASCWGAGGGGVSTIQFPAVQNGCGNTIYLIRRRAGGEGPQTLAGVDSYLATQFKRLIRRRWGDKLIGKPQAQVPQKKQRPVPNVSRQRTIFPRSNGWLSAPRQSFGASQLICPGRRSPCSCSMWAVRRAGPLSGQGP